MAENWFSLFTLQIEKKEESVDWRNWLYVITEHEEITNKNWLSVSCTIKQSKHGNITRGRVLCEQQGHRVKHKPNCRNVPNNISAIYLYYTRVGSRDIAYFPKPRTALRRLPFTSVVAPAPASFPLNGLASHQTKLCYSGLLAIFPTINFPTKKFQVSFHTLLKTLIKSYN